jgi:hypothetical protein
MVIRKWKQRNVLQQRLATTISLEVIRDRSRVLRSEKLAVAYSRNNNNNCLKFRIVFWDDAGGSSYLWNVVRQLFYTAVHLRKQFWTSYSPPWEIVISNNEVVPSTYIYTVPDNTFVSKVRPVPLKRRSTSTRLHGAISQWTLNFILIYGSRKYDLLLLFVVEKKLVGHLQENLTFYKEIEFKALESAFPGSEHCHSSGSTDDNRNISLQSGSTSARQQRTAYPFSCDYTFSLFSFTTPRDAVHVLCLRSEDAFVITCVANLMGVKVLYAQQDLRYEISSYWRFNV